MTSTILVIIPAYNESGSIATTVNDVLSMGIGLDVLVVDDGSVDETAALAGAAGARVVRLPFNLGIGGAVQTGYRYALINGYDIAVQIDGDGQHDPSYLKVLLNPLYQGCADMVIGSRFLGEVQGFRSTTLRRAGIRLIRALIRLMFGLDVSDPTSGFRACGRRLIKVFAGYYPGDYPEPEAIVVARRLKFCIVEVPVNMRARSAGVSSITFFKSVYYMLKVSLAILVHTLKDRKAYGV